MPNLRKRLPTTSFCFVCALLTALAARAMMVHASTFRA